MDAYQQKFRPNYTSRIAKLRERALNVQPTVCVERARLYTESYKNTEGQPAIVRRAKALRHVLNNMTIYIQDGELLVGNNSSTSRASVIAPEVHTRWLSVELDDVMKAPDKRNSDRHILTDEVKKELKEKIIPYWLGKTVEDRVVGFLPQEVVEKAIPSLSSCPNIPPAPENHLRNGMGHVNVDYGKILSLGAEGIMKKTQEHLENLDYLDTASYEKRHFYQAVMICYGSMIKWARRYAELARKMSKEEKNLNRRRELEHIANNCERAPAKPVRGFWEALQTFLFIQLILFGVEQDCTAVSPGRFDQYLYPFYQKDMEEGKLTRERALELLECLFIKMSEMGKMWDFATATYYGGFSLTQAMVVGGLNSRGEDATNELSYLVLEAERQVGLLQPELGVRIHRNTPENFLMKIAEVVKLGRGKPKLFMDEVGINMLLRRGVSLDEARNYCTIGCAEVSPSGCSAGWVGATQFNVAKCLELALSDGRCLITGMQIGSRTGLAVSFSSWEQVLEAFRKQLAYFLNYAVIVLNTCLQVHAEITPYPFTSALLNDCLEDGRDLSRGGARYNSIGIGGVGVPDVGDSLAALRKLVFEEKAISMGELIETLHNNFEGSEDLRQMLINKAPKYGNDDDYVDMITRRAGQIFCEEVVKHKGPQEQPYWPALIAVSTNVSLGLEVGALPSGRKAQTPLADGGISPVHGMDLHGPTAVLKSVGKLDHIAAGQGTLLNMRFSPMVLQSKGDLVKFVSFLRVYNIMGGFHVQFNVIDSETLRQAQKDPEKYRSLMVRVAGYSAYFVDLDPQVQEDIIARTIHSGV